MSNKNVSITQDCTDEIQMMTKDAQMEEKPDEDDAYLIDYSTLMNLPKSVIEEAIAYAKRKRLEEEKREAEAEYIRLKCIPPWAKSYGGRLDSCLVETGTQSGGSLLELSKVLELKGELEGEGEGEEGEGEEEEDMLGGALKSQITKGKQAGKKKKGSKLELDASFIEDQEIPDKVSTAGSKQIKRKVSKVEGEGGAAEGGAGEGDESRPMLSTDSRVKPGMFSIGLQTQPQMFPFGMQTGRDSLTDSNIPGITSMDLIKAGIDISNLSPSQIELLKQQGLLDEMGEEEWEEEEEKLGIAEGEAAGEYYGEYGEMESAERLLDLGITEEMDAGFRKLSPWLGEEEMEAEFEGEEGGEKELMRPSEESTDRKPGRDTEYLRAQLGDILPKALAEIAWKRPADPVHYLAHRLYHARKQIQLEERVTCQMQSLAQEKDNLEGTSDLEVKTFGLIERMQNIPEEIPQEEGEEEEGECEEEETKNNAEEEEEEE